MASAMNLLHLVPQLPAEIWRIVFDNLDHTDQDLMHMWLDYRLVSKPFKEEVEHIFAKRLISKTSLLISSGSSLYIDRKPVIDEYQSNTDNRDAQKQPRQYGEGETQYILVGRSVIQRNLHIQKLLRAAPSSRLSL